MINSLKNDEYINVNLFGKEKSIRVFCTGDNCYDESGNDKDDGFELNQAELDVLNWFLENVKIEDYKQQILDYCKKTYYQWKTEEEPIGIDDVENEINITAIAINVTEHWQSKDGFVYPEISFFGDCKCDEEGGICIGFRNKEFLGIMSQDWTL